MFQYRQVLVRLRAGDTVREIARSGLMGRDKLGALRAVAEAHGWLDAGAEVPADEAIVAALGAGRRASSTICSVEPHREVVKRWLEAGVQAAPFTPRSSASTPTAAATRPSCACCASCAPSSPPRSRCV